ncbi:porin [Ignatzschineria larvae DSM 13226]|uniref:Porin n=1 Tax=Ignatzschineria larvae DSM 13226 TaxID=1111732 RepID=A0ABZ3BY53_9GAMM|nr:porin [Ignatzschineria larvae]
MMKKSIFAVAVASVLTLGAAHAETVLYGSIRYDYESKKIQGMEQDKEGHNPIKKVTSNRLSNLNDAGSRIGLKGSEDLGNNNAVIYNLEWGFDGMIQDESKDSKWTTRKAILGLTGDWGTVTAGRQDNPFKVTIVNDSVTDDFNGGNVISSAAQRAMTTSLLAQGLSKNSVTFKDGKPVEGDFVNTVNSTKFSRVGKVIAYTTPEFAGFQANAAVMMDSDLYPTNNRKNADLWTINARYAYDLGADNQILAKVGYIQGKVAGAPSGQEINSNTGRYDENNNGRYSSKVWGLYLGYLSDDIKVSASYADGTHKEEDANKQKAKGWDLGASYSFGPNYFSTIRAAYGQNEVKVGGEKSKMKSWAVGFEQKLSTRTRAWVEYGAEETKFHGQGNAKQKDNVVSVGMRHDF